MERTMSNGPTLSPELRDLVVNNAAEMLKEKDALTPAKAETLLKSAAFQQELANRIAQNRGLSMQHQEVINALREQQDSIKETLQHKEGFFGWLWRKTKDVVGGTLRFAGNVLTNPIVMLALLAVGGIFLWKYWNEIMSKLREASARFNLQTEEIAGRAPAVLRPPADPALTNTAGGNAPSVPSGSAEQADPYFSWFWGRWRGARPTGTLPSGLDASSLPPVSPGTAFGGAPPVQR